MYDFKPITINDVTDALDALEPIQRPDGDNEGDPINSATVYPFLRRAHQPLVDHAENLVCDYVRKQGDQGEEANKRAITELRKRGYEVHLNPDQYDQSRLVGSIKVGEWELDLSDPTDDTAD